MTFAKAASCNFICVCLWLRLASAAGGCFILLKRLLGGVNFSTNLHLSVVHVCEVPVILIPGLHIWPNSVGMGPISKHQQIWQLCCAVVVWPVS